MESVDSRGAVQAQNTRVKNVCASTHTIHLRRCYPGSRRTSRAFSKPPNTPQAASAYIIKCPEAHIVFKPTLPLSCLLLKFPRSKAIPFDMVSVIPSPGPSRSSSQDQTKTPLTLDLSDLPPLVQPSPPSNTLIITNLLEPEIFHPANLIQIRDLINEYAPIHTWAPLKSFRRIVVSFHSVPSAVLIRQKLDGELLMGSRIRIYFGTSTPLTAVDQHLPLPKSDKLFFISPPPSPPHGWEMHNEEAPNKIVHAEDLATALARLHAAHIECPSPTTEDGNPETSLGGKRRRRGSSTIVYHPEDHGDSPDLPAIAVEDTEIPGELSPMDAMEGIEGQSKFVHTSRPPVELMSDA
ncbi:Calcipressin-domain-containing protein [Cenococcum geophilum]